MANLTNGDGKGEGKGEGKVGYVGDSSWEMSTSRVEIARWLVSQAVSEMEDRKWVEKMPAMSGL